MIATTKFGRNYNLSVQTILESFLHVSLPFTIEFDITRNTYSSTNVASVRVYNLAEGNRTAIRKDVFDYGDLRTLSLRAGYGTNLPEIFSGNITQAWSVREGNNFITQIESFDGGYAFTNAKINESFPQGTTELEIIKSLIATMPAISFGAVGDSFSGSIGRGNTYSGSSCSLAAELGNGQFFIDGGKAFFLADNECRQGQIQLIDSQSGLLGTPLREQSLITFDMIFEPRIVTGQLIELKSSTDVNFNGAYKVVSVKHRGMISPAVCGDAITSLTLDNSEGSLKVVTTQ